MRFLGGKRGLKNYGKDNSNRISRFALRASLMASAGGRPLCSCIDAGLKLRSAWSNGKEARARTTAQWLVEGLHPTHQSARWTGRRFCFGWEGSRGKSRSPSRMTTRTATAKAMARGGIRWRNDGGCVVLGGEPGEGVDEEALLQDGVEFGDAVVEDFGGA